MKLCIVLGLLLLITACMTKDKEAVKTSLQESCNQGVFSDCQKLGLLEYEDDRHQRAKFFFEKSCDGKIYLDCHRVGVYELNEGNYERSLRFLNIACEGGEKDACADIEKHKEMLIATRSAVSKTAEEKNPQSYESDVPGLRITEKAEYYIRYKFENEEFFKGKNLTYLIQYNNDDVTCYSIDIDNNLGFHLYGKDGLDIVGNLKLQNNEIELVSSKTKVNGVDMPKSKNVTLNLSEDYHLSRHSNNNPYYKKGAFIFHLDKGADKKYEFVFTSCHTDDICSMKCGK